MGKWENGVTGKEDNMKSKRDVVELGEKGERHWEEGRETTYNNEMSGNCREKGWKSRISGPRRGWEFSD